MNFNPGNPAQPEWYCGTVGLRVPGSTVVGFDDGDVRRFSDTELRSLVEVGIVTRFPAGDSFGLVNNEKVNDKAISLTTQKEGRMTDPRVVGVLVGVHEHGVAGLLVHMAHHVNSKAFSGTEAVGEGRTRCRSTAATGKD
eukprot:30313-Pleurochrysis_carterae.AAC.1